MAELKIGVIGIPGKWSTETLANAVEERTGYRRVIDMGEVELDLAGMRLLHHGQDLNKLNGLLVKKVGAEYSPNMLDRLELLRVAEQAGVRVFSPAANILRLIDRLSCTVTLRNAGIPMPATRVTEDVPVAVATVHKFGSAVFKPLYSSKARGMCVLDAEMPATELEREIRAFKAFNPMMYIQKKVTLPGQDIGMAFLSGKYLGSYARVSQTNTWNTTVNSGGRYAAHSPTNDIIELGCRAQNLFNMDFTTVDVAETEAGPIVFEVSAFGGFRGTKVGIGIDVAGLYADYAIKALTE
ncbi:GAK system ATP-grasp enzyme [Pseudomonadota bacterium]